MLCLVARSGGSLRTFPFPEREAVIGAVPGNDLVLPFRGVSRRHARLRPLGREILLVDLGSTNGLVLDGERVSQALLACGGEVRLGATCLTLEETPSSDAEIGLALDGEAARRETLSLSTAAVGVTPLPRSPRAALRLVRLLEGAAGLAAARPVLGCESLLVFHASVDDIAIVECHGPVPDEALGRLLARADPEGALLRLKGCMEPENAPGAEGGIDRGEGAEGASRATAMTVLLGGRPGTGDEPPAARLAAVFAGDGPRADAWERDLFDYLARWLAAAAPRPAAPGSSSRRQDDPPMPLPPGMVPGTSPRALELLAAIAAAARSRRDVLVLGETGTGKELVARAIHAGSSAAAGPFVGLNCAAIPADLAEAELFGIHGRVATGVDPRPGRFVLARGGTLFLDEIGELGGAIQAKLLRVLEEREVLPLGAPAPRRVELRIISASNRDLAAEVAAGRFRADLFYRLRGFEIVVPPLRERRGDLPQLAAELARRAAVAQGKSILGISRRALSRLTEHGWPGNVRELAAAVERAVLLCPDGGVLAAEQLGLAAETPEGRAPAPGSPVPPISGAARPVAGTLAERVRALEREAFAAALAASGGNRAAAARALGLTRNGFNLKLKRLGLEPPHR